MSRWYNKLQALFIFPAEVIIRKFPLRTKVYPSHAKCWSMGVVLFALGVLMGCDPEGRKQCDWYLVYDSDRPAQPGDKYIPVCARNYETKKQDCRLKTTLQYAKKVEMRRFRYVDLEVEDYGLPRIITKITFCQAES